MTITDSQHQFATDVVKKLKKNGFRAQTDLRNEKIGYKIREHTISRVPYMIILGDQELSDRMLTIRTLDSKKMLSMTVPEFIERLVQDLQLKRRALSE